MKKILFQIYTLHFLNDGLKVCLVLLLPFLAKDLSLPLSQVGILGGMINIIQIFAAIIGVWIASKIGGVKTIILAMAFYGLAFFTVGISPNLIFVGLGFILGGLGFSVLHPIAFSLITKMAPGDERGKLVGNFTAVGDIGILALSPTVPFLAAAFGWRETALIYGILIFLIFFSFFLFVKPQKEVLESMEEELKSLEIPLRKNIRFLLSLACSMLDAIVSNPIYLFIPFLFLYRGVSPSFLGIFTASFFIGSFIGKSIIGRLTDKIGNINAFIIAEYCMALMLILLSLISFLPIVFILSLFVGIFTRGTSPAIKTIVYDSVGSTKKVQKAFTIENIFNGIGSIFGPIILGFISQKFGITTAFFYGGLVVAIATLPAIIIGVQKRKS